MTSPITIVGAGAIGGTIGAYLARAGVPVQLVDNVAEHVAVIRDSGLRIEAYDETFTVKVPALSPEELTAPLGLVLLAVKAQATRTAIEALAPLLDDTAAVVSMQNGLCERVIAEVIGAQRTIGCLVNFSADFQSPGVISYGGPGTIQLGELDGSTSERLKTLEGLLGPFGDVNITDNVWGYLWSKLGYANMMFASALTDETMADVIDAHRGLVVDLASEVYEVATGESVVPVPFDDVEPSLYLPREARDWDAINSSLDRLVARRRRDQKTHSGIWRDLAVRHRRTEVDEQIGVVAEIGARYGLPMSLTRAVISMIHDVEDGTRKRAVANVEELERLQQGAERENGDSLEVRSS